MDITLLVMAFGLGSHYKGGINQFTLVDQNGELIIEYSVFDAVEACFNKVVFILRKDFKKIFGLLSETELERLLAAKLGM